MKREFFAEFDLIGKIGDDGLGNKNLIDSLTGKTSEDSPRSWENIDYFARLQILCQTVALGKGKKVSWQDRRGKTRSTDVKDYARTGAVQHGEPGGLLWWYYAEESGQIDLGYPQGGFQKFLQDRLRIIASVLSFERIGNIIFSSFPDLSIFPHGSWAANIPFTLRRPYISRDDQEFYIFDNPVKKEWVFKVPYVAPSQWKGALRSVMVRQLVEWWRGQSDRGPEDFAHRRLQLAVLFGDEKGEGSGRVEGVAEYLDKVGGEEAARLFREKVKERFGISGSENSPMPGFRGRLHFYPTFFGKIGLEVINPHDRETGVGKNPIYFECVPAGTAAAFTILYMPLDVEPVDEGTVRTDIRVVAGGIRAMLTTYGFGAKASSGYGVADVQEEQIEVQPRERRGVFIEGWRLAL